MTHSHQCRICGCVYNRCDCDSKTFGMGEHICTNCDKVVWDGKEGRVADYAKNLNWCESVMTYFMNVVTNTARFAANIYSPIL
jgi:hypothetical protein